jgi:hypothetical protein
VVEKSFGEFDATFHAAREFFDCVRGSIGKADALENFHDARLEGGAAKSVKVSLVPQILVRGKFGIIALRLEDDANVTAKLAGIDGGVKSLDDGMASGGEHQGGETSEMRGLAASVRAEQSKEFGVADVKGDAIERSAVLVTVNEILNADYSVWSRPGGGAGRGFIEDWELSGHRSFYTQILRRDGVEHHEGEQQG